MKIDEIIDFHKHPLSDEGLQRSSLQALDSHGVFVLHGFLQQKAIDAIVADSLRDQDKAYYCSSSHNVYLTDQNPEYPNYHMINRQFTSSKGCLTDDQIAEQSPLRILYNSDIFKQFLKAVLKEKALYPYSDPLASINIHFADEGRELGWHFDNSSFAITLLLQAPHEGGQFEYAANLRDANQGEIGFDAVEAAVDGKAKIEQLTMNPGDLILFRGRNSLHRVTPVVGEKTRILSTLAYNSEPNVALSESARQTFFGRIN